MDFFLLLKHWYLTLKEINFWNDKILLKFMLILPGILLWHFQTDVCIHNEILFYLGKYRQTQLKLWLKKSKSQERNQTKKRKKTIQKYTGHYRIEQIAKFLAIEYIGQINSDSRLQVSQVSGCQITLPSQNWRNFKHFLVNLPP